MATIRKRGDLQWEARVRRRGHNTASKTFETRALAEKWARSIERAMDTGTFIPDSLSQKTTFRDVTRRYENEVSPDKKGHVQEKSVLKRLKNSQLADLYLVNLLPSNIAQYRDERASEGVKEATINRELSLISHIFTVAAADWGLYLPVGNPVRLVRRPSVRNRRERRLEEGEEEKLLQAATIYGEPIPTIIRLALETAMRRGEIADLQWANVDLARQVAHLPSTKNGDSRDVPLSSRAVQVLREHRKRQKKLGGKVFDIRGDSITQAFERVRDRAELKDLRFHDLRHEATSRLFEKSLSVSEVRTITGHKTLAMLVRYTHLRAEDIARKLG